VSGHRDTFRARISETLGVEPGQVALFAKGRIALYAILKALDIGPGDEVILPAYTCVAVPNAIIYAGAQPVYADIDPATYTLDSTRVSTLVTSRTRAILAQNTYGLSSDLDALSEVATRRGLTLIDDCTHGLGGTYQGRPNGTSTPISFFSTQWSKPISTGLGGFSIARDPGLAARLRRLEDAAATPSAMRSAVIAALRIGWAHAGRGKLFRVGRGAYRSLSSAGVVPGSSGRDELQSPEIPTGFLAGMADRQARDGANALDNLGVQVERRRAIAAKYASWLGDHGLTQPAPEPPGTTNAFLRFPLRVTNRPSFQAAAHSAGVDLGDWFVSPIHPVLSKLEIWGYRLGTAPNAERACREIVNLPTDPNLGPKEVQRVLRLLESARDLIG
jgi:perosamine synthetase